MRIRLLISLLAAVSLLPTRAAVSLFDFEQEADFAAWQWHAQGESQLERVARFASSGRFSLKFTTPTWKKGMAAWPSFQARPAVSNWTGFDRLVIDITNPDDERHEFSLFISDDKVPFRKGLSYHFELPSRGFQRYLVPLASFPAEVARTNIAVIHLFTQRPSQDLTLYLDNFILLAPGESPPEPGSQLRTDLTQLMVTNLNGAENRIGQSQAEIRVLVGPKPHGSKAVTGPEQSLERCQAEVHALRAELAGAPLALSRLMEIGQKISGLPRQADRVLSVLRFQQACRAAGQRADQLLVGSATSMEKVLPRDVPLELTPARIVSVKLARNEKESFQLLVVPATQRLHRVKLSAGDLRGPRGTVFARSNIQCEVVGYVQTKSRPPYGSSLIGWWPDPILNFLGPVEVGEDDAQAFWIRIRAPKQQPPGEYRGAVTVSAEGAKSCKVELRVRVRGFTLPDHSPLPVAITFSPMDFAQPETEAIQAGWRPSDNYPMNAWRSQRLRWADFLADYYINYDSLYRSGPPDFEVIQRLHDQGRLVSFNLGIFDGVAGDEITRSNTLAGLRIAYDRARELGVLNHAYIYGFDECPRAKFPVLEQTAQRLRKEFPGALLMTTSYDHSYGLNTDVKTIDAWCPLTPSFNPERTAEARAAGRQVWWYICCGPLHPHANMFIEYPAIEGRLLMGPMTARQRPDGFLYYQISIWNSQQPITSGPFTDWDPRSWTTYHGDGSWTCVGPGGAPLPTVRLENFRDGLEDYAYTCILNEIIRRRDVRLASLSPKQRQWLEEAKAAIIVPETLVKSMTDYSREPSQLYAWRDRIGDLIDRSGESDVNPWGKDFDVHGFPAAPK